MSYPKRSPKQGKSEQDWAKQKDKAYGNQKRDQIKVLLLNKFKTKYATAMKDPKAESLLVAEVVKFISQSTLTEANLQKLDVRIAATLKAKPSAAKSPGASPNPKAAVPSVAASPPKLSAAEAKPTAGAEPSAEDNWAYIMEYNKKLHEEEQQAYLEKQKWMKTKMKSELDRQMELKRKLLEKQEQNERDLEARQVRLETDLELKDRTKELKEKERVLKQSHEMQRIAERISGPDPG